MEYIYIVAWTGGYEMPSYKAERDIVEARKVYDDWNGDKKEGDSVDILRVNLTTLEMDVIE